MNTYKTGDRDTRPWGTWEVLFSAPDYIVKRIVVASGGILSLQKHRHRIEHWVITRGVGTVTLGEKSRTVAAGEHVQIAKEQWHRIENRAAEPLEFVEVQMGEILDEADIERRADKYNRA